MVKVVREITHNHTSYWAWNINAVIIVNAEFLFGGNGILFDHIVNNMRGVRPAFVIDLSQVNYSVVK